MIRKFCLISTILVLIFALFTSSLAQETKKPDYVKEKEEVVKKETRKEQVKKTDRSERAIEIEKLSEQLKEIQAKLERVSTDSDEGEKLKGQMREIQKRITQLKARGDRRPEGRNLEARVKELRHAIEKDKKQIAELKETHPDSPKLKELQQRIAERGNTLERLIAQSGREHAEGVRGRREEQTQLKKSRNLITGWVVSGTEDDVTVEMMETGKVMVLRVPLRRREDGKLAKVANLARTAAKLQKNQLILARYRTGEEHGVYFLRNVKPISFARSEGREQPQLIAKMESLEHRLVRIEKALKELLGSQKPKED